jgi:TctA family transporter
MLEDQFRLTMMLSDGKSPYLFYSPISGTLMVLAAIVLASMALPALMKARKEIL